MTLTATTRRKVSDTGLEVTALGLGSAPLGGLYADVPAAQAVEVLDTAWDLGLRYFDTAPMYGLTRCEHLLGQVLREKTGPRVISTKVGRLIRKTSLDELPQLWNVLTGDMSLVGPRPMMPAQAPLYPGQAYYRLRPGLTGYWQISSRNESSFAERAGFDSRYAAELSLRTDVRVLFSTVRVVLRGTGY